MRSADIAIDRLYERLPHADAMCLLDGVSSWDDKGIQCLASSHADARNPLRRAGILSAVHAVEYGAQAAALHGVLSGEDGGQRLLLAAVQDLVLEVDRLDGLPVPLLIEALVDGRGGPSAAYRFRLFGHDGAYARGRLALMCTSEGEKKE